MSDGDLLDVYLHGVVAGVLERRSQARLRFTYDERWVESERQPLSLSLPVRPEAYEHDECSPFFEGLLPEGDFLKAIARTLHVSATNSFQLLTELGGECAGAISVAPVGASEPGRDPRPPRWLGEKELGGLLRELPRRPLIAAIDEVEDGGGFRLSIAGAQDKLGVLVEGEKIGLSYGRPPTTGILKPPIPRVEESVANEAFCMSLAAYVDLDVASASPRLADSQEYLLVHRYDRGGESRDGRIHQEDFCQALGLVPAVKYEREGGPRIADCAELIRRKFSAPARDLTAFLDALLFNFLIANHDAHAKNYSLLLDGPRAIRLAPLYDLISTAVYGGTDRKLAMRYGGEGRPAYVRRRHLDRLANDLGVKPALVRRRAISMRERVEAAVEEARSSLPSEFQDRPIIQRVIEAVAERGEMLTRRATEAISSPELGSSEDLAKFNSRLRSALELVSGGFVNVNADLELMATLFRGSAGVSSAVELEAPARQLKFHGRDIYDGVVDLDAVVEDVLSGAEVFDGAATEDSDLPSLLVELAETAETGVDVLEEVYAGVSEMEKVAPVYRGPVRNMRAGLRDLLEARTIISSWGRKARELDRRNTA